MFGRSPLADIHHLLTSAPVDIDSVAGQDDPAPVDPPTDEVSGAEQRYRRALAFAKRRLMGEASLRASTDHYLAQLINHHARCIMMPRHLVLAAALGDESATGLAEMFQVPLDAAEKRLSDPDLRERPATHDQNTER